MVFVFIGTAQAQGPSALIQNLNMDQQQTLVYYGTSLTHGGYWTKLTANALKDRYGDLITVHNSAQSGKDSRWGLENFEARVLSLNPDAVTIEFSMNDTAKAWNISVELARNNLLEMIARLKDHKPQVEIILLTMNPLGGEAANRPSEHPYYRDLPAYYEMVGEVASIQQLRLIDLNGNWIRWRAVNLDKFAMRVPDGVHPDVISSKELIHPAVMEALGFVK